MGNSWYVETLLRTSNQIRSNIITYTTSGWDIVESADLDDNDYNNLLLVEKTISQLVREGKISKKELEIVNLISEHRTYIQVAEDLGMDRGTVYGIFQGVCDRIAFILGGEFTNEGYVNELGRKYRLTEEQKEQLRLHMRYNINNRRGLHGIND